MQGQSFLSEGPRRKPWWEKLKGLLRTWMSNPQSAVLCTALSLPVRTPLNPQLSLPDSCMFHVSRFFVPGSKAVSVTSGVPYVMAAGV